ncbi:lipoyl synthase [Candidatus Erwinia haradaeae]|uniref:Lipoyl synthase n=1 Tax=Candidatus Erwinia haradaeae TaxID=1922217 RepID=A0A451D491_9GAMM|nr:lipoyl synthase [Candidatus Erwinia haradaeae]VFP80477.1 Lipoyl synthase [Candidatus Erwinia haradaeae]
MIKNSLKCRAVNILNTVPLNKNQANRVNILPKPKWIKITLPADPSCVQRVKSIIRKHNLYSVCEEASCPNLSECFSNGTATFMILGATCTRRCPFCDVTHGRPMPPNINEPNNIAKCLHEMNLRHVVITSVNRDDLHDGGAQHFSNCISVIRKTNPSIKIEILVPDFRGCMSRALKILSVTPPNIFNHNLESVPRIYHLVRPGANYKNSLKLLQIFKTYHPDIPTKSGLMVGLGETNSEIEEVMHDLRCNGVTILTIGQYLQPSPQHLPVKRYVSPFEFNNIKTVAVSMGFLHVSCGPLVRSSYHADIQIKELNT